MAIFFFVLMYKFKISNYLHMRSVASTNFFFQKWNILSIIKCYIRFSFA